MTDSQSPDPAPPPVTRYRTPTFHFGKVREGYNLDRARWIADDLEDEERVRRMRHPDRHSLPTLDG
jgi:hypothetical protein